MKMMFLYVNIFLIWKIFLKEIYFGWLVNVMFQLWQRVLLSGFEIINGKEYYEFSFIVKFSEWFFYYLFF